MKKKLVALLLSGVMVFSLVACGSKKDDTFILSEADLSKYVTLNEDYDVFNVELEPIEVTNEQVNTQINNLLLDKTPTVEKLQTLANREVVSGDTVNIDFVGKKDGVAFEGGTSYQPTDLKIGSGSFIPGFEEGLIGKKAGEVVTLDLTFPENYQNSPELAGQAVQFEVTIHYIVPTYADLVSEVIPDLYEGCTTEAELRNKVKQDIYDSIYASNLEYEVVQMMETKCTYGETLPEAIKEESYNNIMTNLSSYASMYGMDLETYVYLSYYQDLETFKNETANELAEYNTKYLLFCQAYANEKDLNLTKEELNEKLDEYAVYYGLESREELDAKEVESVRNTLMNIKVLDYIMANANVTFKAAQADETVTE